MYIPFQPHKLSLGNDCGCSTNYERELTCVDRKGSCLPDSYVTTCISIGCYHSKFCSCESEAETLIRAHLFPATPKQPQLAFSFKLLDWLEALMLECQVSAKDFVSAIDVLTDVQLMKVQLHTYTGYLIPNQVTYDKEVQHVPGCY